MNQATYLDLQDENIPAPPAKGMFGLFSFSGSAEQPVVNEARDDFHPSIMGATSGESLAFDTTKIFASNQRPEPSRDQSKDVRGILSNSKPGIAAGDNTNQSESEVYTGMSAMCKNDLTKDDQVGIPVSARAKKFTIKKESFLDELKRVSGNNENRLPIKVTSRWLQESREAEESENLESEFRRSTMSPKKYSVSKIVQARTGPPPKSDDFFSELKQWHKDYALRSVEKPGEITVIDTVKPEPQAEEKKEIYFEKAVAEQTEEEREVHFEKHEVEVDQENAKVSKKKKKKFWKLPALSKRKQKSESDPNDSHEPAEKATDEPIAGPTLVKELKLDMSEEREPVKSEMVDETASPNESAKEVQAETVVSAQEAPVVLEQVATQESKLEPEGGKPKDEYVTLSEPKKEQAKADNPEPEPEPEPEILEPDDVIHELLQADSWLAETFFKKDKAFVENIITEGEEESLGEEKKPWLGKISGYFKESMGSSSDNMTDSLEETTTNQESSVEETNDSTNHEESLDATNQSESVVSEIFEGKEWFGKFSGLFKKDRIEPPVRVIEVDRYEIDKYEAFAAEEEDDDDEDDTVKESLPGKRMYRRDYGEGSSFDNELREEVDHFIQTRCSCMVGHIDINPTITREEAKVKKIEALEGIKLSWFDGLFSPTTRAESNFTDEVRTTECSVGVATAKASNNARGQTKSDVSESTIPSDDGRDNTKQKLKKAASKEEIKMLTLADGTNVIKMTALMDLYPSESRSLVDSPEHPPTTESSPCPDSKEESQKTKAQKKTKKKSKKSVKSGATLFGNLEPSHKKKQRNKDKKKRAQTLF